MAQQRRRRRATEPQDERHESEEPASSGPLRSPADARQWLLTAGWFFLAGIASLYLATLWFFPPAGMQDAIAPVANAVPSTDKSTIKKLTGRMFLGTARKEVRVMTLDDVTSELSDLKNTVTELQSRNSALSAEIDALNEALRTATGSLPAKKSSRQARTPSSMTPGISTVMRPLPGDGFGDDALTKSPIPIASVAAPTRTLFAVELSKGASVKALKAAWKQLGKRHGSLLDGLKARRAESAKSGGNRSKWRLLAGPFANAAEAASLCARLRARKAKCSETVFAGEAL